MGNFIGPDNGVFTYVLAEAASWRAVELSNPDYRLPHLSDTFHGRDLFSPAAAHLASGVCLEDLGPQVLDPVTLPLPRLEIGSGVVVGEILHADRFGNLVTSVGRLQWEAEHLLLSPAFRPLSSPPVRIPAEGTWVEVEWQRLKGLRRTYGEVGRGELLALIGSAGFLEIAVREGSAEEVLGARRGDVVSLRF
jgi:S-adenosylmethionine hydrolase